MNIAPDNVNFQVLGRSKRDTKRRNEEEKSCDNYVLIAMCIRGPPIIEGAKLKRVAELLVSNEWGRVVYKKFASCSRWATQRKITKDSGKKSVSQRAGMMSSTRVAPVDE